MNGRVRDRMQEQWDPMCFCEVQGMVLPHATSAPASGASKPPAVYVAMDFIGTGPLEKGAGLVCIGTTCCVARCDSALPSVRYIYVKNVAKHSVESCGARAAGKSRPMCPDSSPDAAISRIIGDRRMNAGLG